MSDQPNPERPARMVGWTMQSFVVRAPVRRFTPPADVYETEDGLVVLVEIGGMRAEDFAIGLYDNHLAVSGTRPRPTLVNAAYHQAEIGFGLFRVDLPLPWPVAVESVRAHYANGFLRIELPRQAPRHVHRVDVTTDDDRERLP